MKVQRIVALITGVILLLCGGLLIAYGSYVLTLRDQVTVTWKDTLMRFGLGLAFVTYGAKLIRQQLKKRQADVLDDFSE